MNTKLTLTIDKRIISKAKKYAKNSGRSLSGLVENYFKNITSDDDFEFEISPRVRSLLGSFKAPKDFNYKEELTKILIEKYSK